jgi:hypothetical protein
MKKILSLVVVVLIAVGHGYANGTEPNSPLGMSVIKHGALVKLFYRGEQSGKVKVTIYNKRGVVVFKETLENTQDFMRPYNFSSLPSGSYTIELCDEQGKRFQKVIHSSAQGKRVAHLTRLHKGENTYVLAVPNKGDDKLTVKIYDQRNSILYEETQVIEGNFAKVYNLNKVGGQHIFEITDKSGRMNRLTKPLS